MRNPPACTAAYPRSALPGRLWPRKSGDVGAGYPPQDPWPAPDKTPPKKTGKPAWPHPTAGRAAAGRAVFPAAQAGQHTLCWLTMLVGAG